MFLNWLEIYQIWFLIIKMFDKDEKGFISLADLQSILYNAFTMNPNEVEVLFNKVDTKKDGLITFGNII